MNTRIRLVCGAVAAVLLLGGLTSCEIVPPASPDTAAPALLDVVGKPADQAAELLRNAGYRVAIRNSHGDAVPATADRLVSGQEPTGGTRLSAGRVVTLTLAQ